MLVPTSNRPTTSAEFTSLVGFSRLISGEDLFKTVFVFTLQLHEAKKKKL